MSVPSRVFQLPTTSLEGVGQIFEAEPQLFSLSGEPLAVPPSTRFEHQASSRGCSVCIASGLDLRRSETSIWGRCHHHQRRSGPFEKLATGALVRAPGFFLADCISSSKRSITWRSRLVLPVARIATASSCGKYGFGAIHEVTWLSLPLTSDVEPPPIAQIPDMYPLWVTREDVTSS